MIHPEIRTWQHLARQISAAKVYKNPENRADGYKKPSVWHTAERADMALVQKKSRAECLIIGKYAVSLQLIIVISEFFFLTYEVLGKY